MIKNVLTSIAMLMCFSNASAGFVPETWTNNGQSPLESYVNLYPIGADAGQQWFKRLSFPDVVNISAGTMNPTVGEPVEIEATVTYPPFLPIGNMQQRLLRFSAVPGGPSISGQC